MNLSSTEMNDRIRIVENGKRVAVDPCLIPCNVERGTRIIGGKWKGSILWYLQDGPVRFNDLNRMLAGASRKIIDQRLKEMEIQGLLSRTILSERPKAVSYELTTFGRDVINILEQLKNWVEQYDIHD